MCCVHSHKFNRNLSRLSSSYRVEEDNTYTTVKLTLLQHRIGLQRADIQETIGLQDRKDTQDWVAQNGVHRIVHLICGTMQKNIDKVFVIGQQSFTRDAILQSYNEFVGSRITIPLYINFIYIVLVSHLCFAVIHASQSTLQMSSCEIWEVLQGTFRKQFTNAL